jgi:hypothetical protein
VSQADVGWVPPLEPGISTRVLPALLPPISSAFSESLARLPLNSELPDGFDGAVDALESWMMLLLLDAMQRLGFFTDLEQVKFLACSQALPAENIYSSC